MIYRRATALLTLVLLLLVSGCIPLGVWPTVVKPSGIVITQEYKLEDFTSVKFGGAGQIVLQQGDTNHLSLQADENLIDKLLVEVKDGVLHLGFEKGLWNLKAVSEIIYTLTVKDINAFEVVGGASFTGSELTFQDFALRLDGGSSVNLDDLKTGTLQLLVNGGGAIELSGEAQSFTCELNGAGNIEAQDLRTQAARIKITGAGAARVWAQQSLDAHLTGAGSISYYGSPQVTEKLEGLGTIERIGEK